MLRTKATRPLSKVFPNTFSKRSSRNVASYISKANIAAPSRNLSSKRPTTIATRPSCPLAVSLLQYATKSGPPYDKIDPNAERKVLEQQIEAHPDDVSYGSSTRHVFEKSQNEEERESDMFAGIKTDLETVKDTFRLNEVPRESYYIGGAGVLPYLGTSLSTVYLAYDINHAADNNGMGLLISPETAHQLLAYIEPIQIGYGAVIISFLGAIHWGLEYAGYGGKHSYRRYAIGVIAPAVAWPTMLMPIEYALITQFFAFNFLYFTDARATVRGWCPPWYSTYRFVLTFIVGASIVLSLVGRGQIADKSHSLPGPAQKMQELRDSQWENLEKEEKERRAQMAKADAEADASDDEEADNEDSGDEKEQEDDSSDDEGSDDKKKGKEDNK